MIPPRVAQVPDFDLFRSPDSDQYLLRPNTRYAKDWVMNTVEAPHWRGSCLVYGQSEILDALTGAAKTGLIVSSLALTYRLLLTVVREAEGLDPSPIDLSFIPALEMRLTVNTQSGALPAPEVSASAKALPEPNVADRYRLSGLGVKWDPGTEQ